ncbi:MAG: hypothetical protein ACR2P1_09100 [Pseudomonadales bacterium]
MTLGPQQNQSVIVVSGLQAGERVAANGAFKLRDGVLVNAKEPVAALQKPAAG